MIFVILQQKVYIQSVAICKKKCYKYKVGNHEDMERR